MRYRFLVAAGILLILGTASLWWGMQHKPRAVLAFNAQGSAESDALRARLGSSPPSGGGTIDLATFYTDSGPVSLGVIFGQFSDKGIAPETAWQGLKKYRTAIVNSVDDREDTTDAMDLSITRKIIVGCHLTLRNFLVVGRVEDPQECVGVYKDYGIRDVFDVAIITAGDRKKAPWALLPGQRADENAPDRFQEPCVSAFKDMRSRGYQDCVQSNVKAALHSYFSRVENTAADRRPQVLILPALGTGIGELPKDMFYRSAFDEFVDALKTPEVVPRVLYFQVWPGDKVPYSVVADNIRDHLLEAMSAWRTQHPDSAAADQWLSASGVAFALASILILASKYPQRVSSLAGDPAHQTAILLGWAAAALGIATSARWLTGGNVVLTVLVGIAATWGARYLLVSRWQYEEAMKSAHGVMVPVVEQ